jgi:hypothetical protein
MVVGWVAPAPFTLRQPQVLQQVDCALIDPV